MVWTWQAENAEGVLLTSVEIETFGNQSDAESWLGEFYPELVEQGVAAVTLFHDAKKVYGPMSLEQI